MANNQNATTPNIHSAPLAKRMLQGGAIALVLIALFLSRAGEPKPEWPTFWMVRPLLVVPFAGAMGGLCFYLLDSLRYQGGWRKILANVLSLLIYIFGLWIGTVLGLDGTHWN
ncbi:hypothetical protein MKQ68_11315 [Chitinophaga horti]|uniref:Potassium transporter KefB n=1 Tax=Chitinophaga horti TaxID=2920382 RepID=A0ABY6J7M2_9BACT|nr:hypothetical protein [Chitinophaga horti]UYQ95690.1 hypothetical protein MKQ68_11315 [Chitinophaga horti]